MRQYSVDERGVEHVIQLGIENWWMGDLESFVMLKPSSYNIDAWENCELLTITQADVFSLAQQIPAVSSMIRSMDEKNSISNQRRINSTISHSAENRYANFLREHPDLLQRFPLHVIASFLGIAKETLSRVRKNPLL
jgi:CRP-like cAMP-binding protein